MKTLLLSISVTAAILAALSCSSVKATSETVDGVTKQVEGKDYTIEARYANPMRGKTIPLSYGYELKVKADSAFANLPYFGVAQKAPYGAADGGIKFAEPMSGYTVKPNRKNNGWEVSFKVKTRDYAYDFTVNIFNNGNASFTVSSTDRDVISYNGNIK